LTHHPHHDTPDSLATFERPETHNSQVTHPITAQPARNFGLAWIHRKWVTV
jgi:hypothetical protein